MFVALDGWARLQIADAVEPEPAQDAADRGPAQAGLPRDAVAGPALPAQLLDPRDPSSRWCAAAAWDANCGRQDPPHPAPDSAAPTWPPSSP